MFRFVGIGSYEWRNSENLLALKRVHTIQALAVKETHSGFHALTYDWRALLFGHPSII